MLNLSYLSSLPYQQVDSFPGFFAVADHRRPDSSRFICTYSDGKRHKQNFFLFLGKLGQLETSAEWELHHIVEGRHYADVDFRGELTMLYEDVLPCVLIHRSEHELYSRLASIRATKELYLTSGLSNDMNVRSTQVAQEAGSIQNRAALEKRLEKLISLYRHAYEGDYVLQKIALNVLADAAEKL